MANEILTPKSYLTMYDEPSWGTPPGSITYYHIPVDTYNVRFRPQNRQSTPHTGLYQQKHSTNHRGYPAGQLTVPLYGWQPPSQTFSLAEYLVDWAFESWELTELPSKGAEWAQGPDIANYRHHGLRVQQATLKGNTEQNQIQLELDLIGKSEENFATAQTLPDDRNKLVDMEFQDCSFSLGGSTIQLRAFELSIRHSFAIEFLNSANPTGLFKRTRSLQLVMVPIKNSDTYSAYRRALQMQEFTGQIVLSGLHNSTGATGTRTIGTIDFPRLSFVNSEEAESHPDVMFEALQLKPLKPDTSANDMAITWTEA
jgi:hypothetical protein